MYTEKVLAQASQRLSDAGVESPRWDAELLLAHVLGTNRAQVLAWPERQLTPQQLARFQDLVARRSEREPLAYILGQWEFFGLAFEVDRRVLIPRPETELLVERALGMARRMTPPLRIADVGAGSGAIAVSLAVHLPEATVYALDESPDSLALAAENARHHGVGDRVHCLAGDLLAPLPEPVHLIAANLPYVTTEEWQDLAPEIRDYEPRAALDGGPNGLALIRRLLAAAAPHLLPGGAILLEIGAEQGKAATSLARQHFPKATVLLQQDYAGLDRLVIIEV